MSDRAALFLISAVLVVVSLGAAVWLVATGQALSLDGLFLLASCLVLALAFGLYIWSVIRQAMLELKESSAAKTQAAAAAAPKPAPVEVEKA
jgi:hypothetical protein